MIRTIACRDLIFYFNKTKRKKLLYGIFVSFESLSFSEFSPPHRRFRYLSRRIHLSMKIFLLRDFFWIFESRTRIECMGALFWFHKEFMGHPADTVLSFYESKIRNKIYTLDRWKLHIHEFCTQGHSSWFFVLVSSIIRLTDSSLDATSTVFPITNLRAIKKII